MICPACGSTEAWVRGKERSRQEGYWVQTTLECRGCGLTARISLNLDTHDQRVLADEDIEK